MRDTIYLRRGLDGCLERTDCLSDYPQQWSPTKLSEKTIYNCGTLESLEDLFDQWSKIEYLDNIEQHLNLETQYDIGRMLCRELGATETLRVTRWLHLVPVLAAEFDDHSRDENKDFLDLFCRIPWNLITRSDDSANPIFLARDPQGPASITINAFPSANGSSLYQHVRLPPFPRVLLVVPTKNNTDRHPTQGVEHLGRLISSIVVPYKKLGIDNRIVHVTTFDDFQKKLRTGIDGLAPHIIYFYGHADALENTSEFLFDDANGEKGAWVNIDQIRLSLSECVRKWSEFPPVIWINACKGASAKRNSFLRFLSPLASTVLTTRTIAAIDDSRGIAESALPMIVQGTAPHSALRSALDENMPPVTSGRWATTVVSVQYELWSALAPEDRQIDDADSAGDFPSRMDRVNPLLDIEAILREHFSLAAAPLSIGWKGDGEQRIDMFEQRVVDLLQERLHLWPTIYRRVELQLDACPGVGLTDHFLTSIWAGIKRERAFTGMKVPNLSEIQSAVKRLVTKETRALLLEHGPFTSAHGEQISEYVAFWNEYFGDLIPKDLGLTLVLAFGFSKEPSPIACPEVEILRAFVELGPVSAFELGAHLSSFQSLYRLTKKTVPTTAQLLIEECGGSFKKIHARLEKIANNNRWTQELSEKGYSNERV